MTSPPGSGPRHARPNALRITVVMAHLNQPDLLERCLASLAAGQRQPDEIIVVDNGSQEMPEAVCAAFPGVTLLREDIPGPGPARNLGVAHASSEIIAFTDADCKVAPDWLSAAEAAMTDPKVMILGGDVRIYMEDPDRPTIVEAYESIYAYRIARYIERDHFAPTANMIARRAVLSDVGPFGGIGVAEDRDWGQRATAKGYTIRYAPEVVVYHPARPSIHELQRKWDRLMGHDYALARSRPGGRVKWALKLVALALSPPAELPGIVTSPRIKGLRARALAFSALCQMRFYRSRRMAGLLLGASPEKLAGQWNRPKS